MSSLIFESLKIANKDRAEKLYNQPIKDTLITDWVVALAGECGEFCNVIKKLRRLQTGLGKFNYKEGEQEVKNLLQQAKDEIGDLIIYADIIAQALDIDLGEAVKDKFNEVSKRNNCEIVL